MTERPRLSHLRVLFERLPLGGRRLLDVGSGSGRLARRLAAEGARTVALDPQPGELAKGKAATRPEDLGDGSLAFVAGYGQSLPFAEGAFNAVVFFNSLHHVPVELQAGALDEAVRVVQPGGCVYVVEPLAEGDWFQMVRVIEDETEVRAAAQRALAEAPERLPLEALETLAYLAPRKVGSFAELRAEVIAVDPAREAPFDAHAATIEAAFDKGGEPAKDGGRLFHLPMKMDLFRRLPAG